MASISPCVNQWSLPLKPTSLTRSSGHQFVSTDRLTPRDAAEYLGIAESTLAVWRSNKRYKLPYIKVGRLIRYKLSDLDAFIESRTVSNKGAV